MCSSKQYLLRITSPVLQILAKLKQKFMCSRWKLKPISYSTFRTRIPKAFPTNNILGTRLYLVYQRHFLRFRGNELSLNNQKKKLRTQNLLFQNERKNKLIYHQELEWEEPRRRWQRGWCRSGRRRRWLRARRRRKRRRGGGRGTRRWTWPCPAWRGEPLEVAGGECVGLAWNCEPCGWGMDGIRRWRNGKPDRALQFSYWATRPF